MRSCPWCNRLAFRALHRPAPPVRHRSTASVRRQLRLGRGLCSAGLYAPRGRARGINPRATVGESGRHNRKSRITVFPPPGLTFPKSVLYYPQWEAAEFVRGVGVATGQGPSFPPVVTLPAQSPMLPRGAAAMFLAGRRRRLARGRWVCAASVLEPLGGLGVGRVLPGPPSYSMPLSRRPLWGVSARRPQPPAIAARAAALSANCG